MRWFGEMGLGDFPGCKPSPLYTGQDPGTSPRSGSRQHPLLPSQASASPRAPVSSSSLLPACPAGWGLGEEMPTWRGSGLGVGMV